MVLGSFALSQTLLICFVPVYELANPRLTRPVVMDAFTVKHK